MAPIANWFRSIKLLHIICSPGFYRWFRLCRCFVKECPCAALWCCLIYL